MVSDNNEIESLRHGLRRQVKKQNPGWARCHIVDVIKVKVDHDANSACSSRALTRGLQGDKQETSGAIDLGQYTVVISVDGSAMESSNQCSETQWSVKLQLKFTTRDR